LISGLTSNYPYSALGACDVFTDSATRLAFDIERGIGGLGKRDGDEFVIVHRPTLKTPGRDGRVRVQLDIATSPQWLPAGKELPELAIRSRI